MEPDTSPRYRFLVAQANSTASRGLVRWAQRYGECNHVVTIDDAITALASTPSLTAFVADEALGGGVGMVLVEAARRVSPRLPILFVSSRAPRAVVARAFRLDVTLLRSPISARDVDLFLSRATLTMSRRVERRSSQLQLFSRTFALSPRQEELLLLLSSGVARRELAAQVGMSENTVKTQVRSILKKTQAHSLEHALYLALIDSHDADER